jgi:hypothetical protein
MIKSGSRAITSSAVKIFKCAAKGDLSRYSRVLSDPVVGEHFTRYLGSEFEKCKKEVEYAALESGDSVVLVDDSADRVLSAARSLQRACGGSRCRRIFASAPPLAPSRFRRPPTGRAFEFRARAS